MMEFFLILGAYCGLVYFSSFLSLLDVKKAYKKTNKVANVLDSVVSSGLITEEEVKIKFGINSDADFDDLILKTAEKRQNLRKLKAQLLIKKFPKKRKYEV